MYFGQLTAILCAAYLYTVYCLTFQALVQLLWSDRSYTFTLNSEICHVSNRQNLWPMLSTTKLFHQIHNDEYCMVLVATIKLVVF